MARTKADWTGTIRGGLIWVTPVFDNTETRAGTRAEPVPLSARPTVPAIDATGPDGRRWFLTFESEYSAKFDGNSRDRYIKRMRALGERLIEEADKMQSDPRR
jgi:hypothetical protein